MDLQPLGDRLIVGVLEEEELDERALGALPRHDHRPADAALHRVGFRVEPELSLGFLRPVALEAGSLEDRLDVAREVDGLGTLLLVGNADPEKD